MRESLLKTKHGQLRKNGCIDIFQKLNNPNTKIRPDKLTYNPTKDE
jgi:hypothetical protein